MPARRRAGKGMKLIILSLVMVLLLVAAIASPSIHYQYQEPVLKPVEQPKSFWDQIAEPIVGNPVIRSFGEALGLIRPEEVGIYAEIGYTSTSGESIVFMQKFSGVGFLGMSGIYVKPSLGSYKALKLFDDRTDKEGEIWVRPIIKVRLFNGTPEHYSFQTKIKIKSDGETIAEKTLTRAGKGAPPTKLVMDKVSIRGKALHLLMLGRKADAIALIKGLKKNVETPKAAGVKPGTRQLCFYADYQGVVKFEEDEEPVVKELKDLKLGCFTFEFKETGDFEMIVDKNVTVAPLAEVMAQAEAGMGGMEKIVETRTVTVTIPYTSYVTTILTTGAGGQVTTITQTITEYQTRTLTKTYTKWKTTTKVITKMSTRTVYSKLTTTVEKTVTKGTTYYITRTMWKTYTSYIWRTLTKTVTKTVYGGGGYGGSVFGNVTVIAPEGVKPIAEVRPGDLVLTEEGFKPVEEVKIIRVDNLYRITLKNGLVLLADDAQPVITIEGKKPVRELEVGDELLTLDGPAKITSIQRLDQEADVYDLVFEEPLNYYANGILVNDLKAGVLIPTVVIYYPYSEFIFLPR